MENKNSILTIAVVGIAAYFGYEKLLKPYLNRDPKKEAEKVVSDIEKQQTATKDAIKTENQKRQAFYELESIQNPNSFAGKVAKIQGALGVEIDGKPGKRTNGAFQKRYGLVKGPINRQNIDFYVQVVEREKFLFM